MDRISELPDDLLLRILSLVDTKTAVDAQILSKRWRNLWKKLPSLCYDSASHKTESQFLEFVHKTMELLETPDLDCLYLRVARPTETSSDAALICTDPDQANLVERIYQFQTLVILRLEGLSLNDSFGNPVPLTSLQVLQLCRVKYSKDESLSYLVSNLPSLKELILDQCSSSDPANTLSIAVPSLQRLTVLTCRGYSWHGGRILNVNAPGLKYLKVKEYRRNVSFSDEKMEELVEANVTVRYTDKKKLLRSLISVKRLSLCLDTLKIPRVDLFDQLVHLELCTCQNEWWNFLERVLLDSPRLRVLKLHHKHCSGFIAEVEWIKPSFVPESFASHLETFEWSEYEGTGEEGELLRYMLKNARRLKTVTIDPQVSFLDTRSDFINRMRREF